MCSGKRRPFSNFCTLNNPSGSLPKGPGIAPGEKSPLVVELIGPDGNVFVTEEQGGGKVMWEDLQVATSVVTANQKGVVSLPKDPRVSDGKVAHVTIPQEIAWRVFTRGIDQAAARAQIKVEGDAELALHVLSVLAIVG